MVPEVRYFKQGTRYPVAELIEDLADMDEEAAAKAADHIRVLAAEGPTSPALDCRHLEDGLWELKVRSRVGQHRIFYGVEEGVLWLLHAITKKSRKTPQDALDVARKRMKEVQN